MLLFAEEIGKLLSNPGSYPVRVSYFPHPAFKFALSSAICDMRHNGSVVMILVPVSCQSCARAVPVLHVWAPLPWRGGAGLRGASGESAGHRSRAHSFEAAV